jgi:hypothetical protein
MREPENTLTKTAERGEQVGVSGPQESINWLGLRFRVLLTEDDAVRLQLVSFKGKETWGPFPKYKTS